MSAVLLAGPVLLAVERPPTRWGEHLLATAVLLGIVGLLYLLMWRGWRRRARRDRGLPELPPVPDRAAASDIEPLGGLYLGTTAAGDWLDRIVAHGLGERARAQLRLLPAGIVVDREGAAPFLIPASALRGARLDRGIANRVLSEGSVLVVTWDHGGRRLDTGVRGATAEGMARWRAVIEELGRREARA